MYNFLCSLTVTLCLPVLIYGQSVNGSGTILDMQEQPLEFATIAIYAADLSLLSGTVSDSTGGFSISISPEAASLVISLIGYKQISIAVLDVGESSWEIGTIYLEREQLDLEEVLVTSERSPIERKLDRLVVHVDKQATFSGQNAIDILDRSPGVLVDANGTITLRGRSGVQIIVDQRPIRLSGEDLSQYLRNIQSSGIEQIELIHNPSAEFGADGSAGVIRIVTRRASEEGLFSVLNTSYGQGVYGRASTGISTQSKFRQWSFTSNVQHTFDQRYNQLITNRNFNADQDSLFARYDQSARTVIPTHSLTGDLNVAYQFPSGWAIGTNLSANRTSGDQRGFGIARILNDLDEQTGGFQTSTTSADQRENLAVNMNLSKSIEKKGAYSLDLDYGRYINQADQGFTTQFENADQQPTEQTLLAGRIDGELDLYAAQFSFNWNIPGLGQVTSGGKSSFVRNTNLLAYTDIIQGMATPNTALSNHFQYQEGIQAWFVSWQDHYGPWQIQIGMRGEQTRIDGEQVTTGERFDQNFTQHFPTAFIEYKPNDTHRFGWTLGRRINRPNYDQLNPFIRFVDISTYRTGNPRLVPENTWNAEWTYSYRSFLDVSLLGSRTENNILPVLIQDNEEKVTRVQMVNIGQYHYAGLNFTYSMEAVKGLSSRLNVEVFYNEFLGEVADYDLDAAGVAFRLRCNNRYRLSDGWAFEANGFYQPVYQYGITAFDPRWRIDIGCQKTFWQNRATLNLNATDLFWAYYPRGSTLFGNIDESFQSIRDTRVITVSFSLRFGKSNLSFPSRKKGGAEDERNRIG